MLVLGSVLRASARNTTTIFKTQLPHPTNCSRIKIWSIMSNIGDGFITVSGDDKTLSGNGTLNDEREKSNHTDRLNNPSLEVKMGFSNGTPRTGSTAPKTAPQPVNGSRIKIWSLMSKKGDGLIAASANNVSGNGSLDDDNALFIWIKKGTNGKDSEKSISDVQLKYKKTDGKDYYITATATAASTVTLQNAETKIQKFTVELWPQSDNVDNAGSYFRFKVGKSLYLGCNGDGKVSVMKMEPTSNSSYGSNYFPNPGTLFYIYDLG